MLDELQVRDFAIIDHLQLRLEPGLNVLTGETGAGKSILVDALGALNGSRLGAEVVRTGADQALIEGVIALPPQWKSGPSGEALQSTLADIGIILEEDTLVLSRQISRHGRAIARVQGQAVPLRVLQTVGRLLVDIHGQGEQQSLARIHHHRDLLDAYGGLLGQRQAVAGLVEQLRSIRREMDELRQAGREMARRMDLLSFQVNEIDEAHLSPDEQGQLEQERLVLANAGRLIASAQGAYQVLREGQAEMPPALDLVTGAAHSLHEVSALDPNLDSFTRLLDEASYNLEDVARQLRRYSETIEADPVRLEVVEDRLELIARLRRKYGETIPDILAFGEQARRELETLTNSEERVKELEDQNAGVREQISRLSIALSNSRRHAAEELVSAVLSELSELAMGKARFAIEVSHEPDSEGIEIEGGQRVRFDTGGIDHVEFLIAPNPGEPLMPLAKIASGGELARIMLALKTVLAEADATPVLVFDEVDSGVGGRSGDVVGRKLWSLGLRHQVLCVTHLPQVAVYADAHYRVAKETDGSGDGPERTTTRVRRLSSEEQAQEVSAMLGGSASGQYTHLSAQELLQQAADWKDNRARTQPAPSPE